MKNENKIDEIKKMFYEQFHPFMENYKPSDYSKDLIIKDLNDFITQYYKGQFTIEFLSETVVGENKKLVFEVDFLDEIKFTCFVKEVEN